MSDPKGQAVTRHELSAWLQSTEVNDGDEEASLGPTRRPCSEPNRERPRPAAGRRRRSFLDDDTPDPRCTTALLTDQYSASQGKGSILGLVSNTTQGQQGVDQDVLMCRDTTNLGDTIPMVSSFYQGEGGAISSTLFQRANENDPTVPFQGGNKSLSFQDVESSSFQRFPIHSDGLTENWVVPHSSRLPKVCDAAPPRHNHSMPTAGLSHRQIIGQGGGSTPRPRAARELSHLLEAMERSRKSQGHDAHTRRSFRLMSQTSRTRALLLDILRSGPRGTFSPKGMSIPQRTSAPITQANKRASIDSIGSWGEQETRNAIPRNLMAKHIEEENQKDLMSKFEKHLSQQGGLTGRRMPGSRANHSKAAIKNYCWKPALEADCWMPAFKQQQQFRRLSAEYDVRGMDQERAVQAELERIKRSICSKDSKDLRKVGDGKFQHL